MPAVPELDQPTALPPADNLTGRQRELGRLHATLQEMLGGSGRLVLVAGEVGIGKTSLAEAAARQARERGAKVAWGRCWEEEGAPDLWPWRQVVRACLRSVDESTLRDLVGPHGGELTALVAPLQERPANAAGSTETAAARFRLFNAVAHFLDAYAELTPLVVILDDLHRADPSSLLLLQFFTQEQRQRRILLIGTYREPAPPNRALTQTIVEATREPGTERLPLRGFTEPETERLLAALLGTNPKPEMVSALHARTGGNPLFLTECARYMRDRGETGETHRSASAVDLPIPCELREVIEQRVAALSGADREVLRLAALSEREFEVDPLACLASSAGPQAPEQPDRVAGALLSAEKLGVVERGTEAGRYRFVQDMVREVLCEETPAARRTELRRSLEAKSPAAARTEPAAAPAPPPSSPFLFRKEGEYWTLSFAGRTCRIKDIKGLGFMALLMRYPGKPLHVTELIHLGGGASDEVETEGVQRDESTGVRNDLGDAGVILDEQARCDYRRRLEDLRAELQEAEGFRDTGRAERARHEIEFLTQELSSAIGLGGRVRRANSHIERARVNVTRSINRALERVEESHPELAHHLRRSIRTGTFCSYVPDASVTSPWEL